MQDFFELQKPRWARVTLTLMRTSCAFIVALSVAGSFLGCRRAAEQTGASQSETTVLIAQNPSGPPDPKNPPETIIVKSSYGDVTFTHRKHYERVNGDCSVCHPKVFPQALAPLNYKKALHRAAEAGMTSCAYCHSVGSSAFAADSNCTKCHALREH